MKRSVSHVWREETSAGKSSISEMFERNVETNWRIGESCEAEWRETVFASLRNTIPSNLLSAGMEHKTRHRRFISKNPANNIHRFGFVHRISKRSGGEEMAVNLHDQFHDRVDCVIPKIGGIFDALVIERLLQIKRHQTVVNRGNRVEKIPRNRLR